MPLTEFLLPPLKPPAKTRKILLVSIYLCKFERQASGGADANGGQLPPGHRREQAMVLTRLAIIVAVLMALAVPCARGTLMVLDARRRAGSPAQETQEG